MSVHPIDYRYGSEEMREIWEKDHYLGYLLRVEGALARAEAGVGMIPEEAGEEIAEKASLRYVDPERVDEIEAEIKHDLMAVVKGIQEVCDGDAGEYVHLGATSNDVKDTARMVQLGDSLGIVEEKLGAVLDALLDLADEYRDLVCVGRTHGQHAVPTTIGHKFAVYAAEVMRHLDRLEELKTRVPVGQMTGAVGTQASFAALGYDGREIQRLTMEELGLEPVVIANQVIQRDRHAEVVTTLAIVASTLDKIGREVRNLQRTELGELEEPFEEDQVGSSTMPQKRNPMLSENVCGLAKVIRGNVQTALENVPLEHERDLTNSSAERNLFPETFLLLDEQLKKTRIVLSGLVVHPENVRKDLEMTKGLNMSEAVMMTLVGKGVGRQTAHALVRRVAMEAYEAGDSLTEALLRDEEASELLTEEEVAEATDPERYLGTVDEQIDEVLAMAGRA